VRISVTPQKPHHLSLPLESGRGLPQSKTLREFQGIGRSASVLDCAQSSLHLTRVPGTSRCLRAVSVNPARGDLFIDPQTRKGSQTPLGVTCALALLCLAGQPADRSPLTGFGSIIVSAGCYKQVTPSGVAGQQAAERGNACEAPKSSGAFIWKRHNSCKEKYA
jgi:hypothetical protein